MAHDHRDRDRRRSRQVDVDPVTLDLIENGLRNARYEMDEVLFRTALSPGIREQHDEFPLIADPAGKMVVGQFGLSIPDFLDGFDGDDRGGRRPAHLRPVRLRRRDQPRQRLAGRHADLRRGPGRRLGVDVRAHVRRRRQDAVVACRPTPARSTRRACVIPPFKLYATGMLNEDALRIILNQVREPGLEPRPTSTAWSRPAAPPSRRVRGDVRPVRHRHLPVRAGRAAAAQLRRHEGAAAPWCSRRAGRSRSPTTSATTASATARTS